MNPYNKKEVNSNNLDARIGYIAAHCPRGNLLVEEPHENAGLKRRFMSLMMALKLIEIRGYHHVVKCLAAKSKSEN